jgi:hypothetical protein
MTIEWSCGGRFGFIIVICVLMRIFISIHFSSNLKKIRERRMSDYEREK